MNNEQIDTYRKLLLLMMRAKQQMSQVIDDRQMTPIQGMLLMLFEPGTGQSMHELSQRMACDASNTTGLIDRLDTQGLVTRTTDPNDRRVKVIMLSESGEECRCQILDALRAAEAADLEKLSPDERKQFSCLVSKILS